MKTKRMKLRQIAGAIKKKRLKVWSGVIGVAVAVALILTLVPVGVTITGEGMLGITLRAVSADPGWLSGYGYRKQLTANGTSAGAQTNYQMPLTIYYDAISSDAVTVSTSTAANGWAVEYPFQRHVFYMVNLLWVFYADGNNHLVYRTSNDDGATWSAATTVTTTPNILCGNDFACFFDNTYIHFTYAGNTVGDDLLYRRYTPSDDGDGTGTLTASAAEQTAYSIGATDVPMYENIVVDSDGYPWIGFCLKPSNYPTSGTSAIVTKSSTNDGTWSTASGFPNTFVSGVTTALVIPHGAKLTNGRTYWAYHKSSTSHAFGDLWTGSAWDGEEDITDNNAYSSSTNILGDGDDVQLAYLTGSSPYDIYFVKRTYGTGWGSESQVTSTSDTSPVLSLRTTDSLVIFWYYSGHIYYRGVKAGSLDASATDWKTETLASIYCLNALPASAANLNTALVWVTGAGSPYNVRCAALLESSSAGVSLGRCCQTDFDDIRFTASNGETPQDYWLEKKVDSNYANVQIELSSIADGGGSPDHTDYYIYYGKAGGTPDSNGANTFIVFDDFERGNDGDAVGGSWTVDAGDADISTEQKYGGTRSLKVIGHAGPTMLHIPATHSDTIAIRFRVYKETAALILWGHGDGSNILYAQAEADEDIIWYDGAAWQDTGDNIGADTWQLLEFTNFVWATPTVDFWLNDAKIQNDADISAGGSSYEDVLYLQGSATVGQDTWIDDVIVRKWASPEPTWGTFGGEETECSPDIANTPSSWSVNSGTPVDTSSTYTTGLTHFQITNNSGGAVDISIQGTDMTGGNTWTLSDTATPGSMICGLKAGLSGGDYTIIVKKNSPYNNLVEDLADEGTQQWGLKLYTPTAHTDGATKTGTVTITATCV